MGIYSDNALAWQNAGYSPIPINPKNKGPLVDGWQRFSEKAMSLDETRSYISEFPDGMIGLVTGSPVLEGQRLVAVDVDDDDLVTQIENALMGPQVGKRGKKGITYFARLPSGAGAGTRRFKRIVDGKKASKPSVELLGAKAQTVIPPSVHPETKEPYKWTGSSLLDVDFMSLPEISFEITDEIAGICEGAIDTILALNTMVWLGVGGGGDTHDVCLTAVGLMVRRQWSDEAIHRRINFAKRRACERNGDEYHWPEAEHVIQGWINDARAKGWDKDGAEAAKKKAKANVELDMVEWVVEYLGGAEYVVQSGGVVRRYQDGHWPQVNMNQVMHLMSKQFRAKNHEIDSAVKLLRKHSYKESFGMIPGVSVSHDEKMFRLCLMNGTVNLKTGKLEKHNPDDELLHQLKFDYDEDAQCPQYERFIDWMFQGDQKVIECLEEYMAYTLIPDNSFQKLLVLIGTGGNGKGTLTRLWSSFFDPSAVSSVSISELNNERMMQALVGKLLNICSEQNRFDTIADNKLKQITGNDSLTVRRLYEEAVTTQLNVRFVLQVNEMPSTNDSSDALRRRFIILNCPNQKIVNPDPRLPEKLITERAGILRKRLIPALIRLYERGEFLIPESSQQLVNDWLNSNDNIMYWLHECCEFPRTSEELKNWPVDKWTPSRELYGHYAEFVREMNYRQPAPEVIWGQRLKGKGYDSVSKYVKAVSRNIKMRPIKIRDGMGGM